MNRRDFLQGSSAAAILLGPGRSSTPVAYAGSLKGAARRCKTLVGAQAYKSTLQWQPQFTTFILENFEILTVGGLKWDSLRPSQSTFNFNDSDWLVSFCEQHGLAVHGHNLCWNRGNPAWVEVTVNQYNAERILTDHITKVVKRYAGKIQSWDVVNEPFWSEGLWDGPWLKALGPQYMDVAFNAAKEADPDSLRVLNIHHVEMASDQVTRDIGLRVVRELLSRGVPVQAVGIESHLDGSRPLAGVEFARFLKELSALGLKILITELDVNDTNIPGSQQLRDAAVAKVYMEYIEAVFSVVQPLNTIFWTVSDFKNWYDEIALKQPAMYRRADGLPHRPGLIDLAFNPKASLVAVQSAFLNSSRR
jgi:endo-1,4-beta-xylanase